MHSLQAVIFDFDGVIVESVDVKGWAFGELFKHYPEHQAEIVKYHFNNGGVSRFKKFYFIYENILKRPLPKEEFENLCAHFSKLVFDKVVESQFVPGAIEVIRKYYKNIPLFIVSGTPQMELVQIIEAKNLKSYFKGVYGSPESKEHWIKIILNANQYNPDNVIFVGDTMSDYRAANEHNIYFIARVPENNNDMFQGLKVGLQMKDLRALDDYINKRI